jgi:hypothetical protein
MSGGTLEYNNQNIVFNHNPNSFFYKSAQHNNELPSDLLELEKECKKNDYNNVKWDTKCNETNFNRNKKDCIKIANCKNYNKVKKLYDKDNNYSASGQLYLDNGRDYKKSAIRSINLTVGSVFLIYIIIRKALE